jgi:hypothetical protein
MTSDVWHHDTAHDNAQDVLLRSFWLRVKSSTLCGRAHARRARGRDTRGRKSDGDRPRSLRRRRAPRERVQGPRSGQGEQGTELVGGSSDSVWSVVASRGSRGAAVLCNLRASKHRYTP